MLEKKQMSKEKKETKESATEKRGQKKEKQCFLFRLISCCVSFSFLCFFSGFSVPLILSLLFFFVFFPQFCLFVFTSHILFVSDEMKSEHDQEMEEDKTAEKGFSFAPSVTNAFTPIEPAVSLTPIVENKVVEKKQVRFQDPGDDEEEMGETKKSMFFSVRKN